MPAERSRGEIETLLRRNGAEGFAYSWTAKEDMIGFQWQGHKIKFTVPAVTESQARSLEKRAQLNRQRWRALLLVMKAKLEAVHAGIAIFEEEFLAYVVTSDGSTVGEVLVPRMKAGQQLALPPAPK